MAYPIKTQEQARDDILSDWRNLDDTVDVAADSDHYIRASGFGSAVAGLYQYAAWGVNQIFPDTADEENLVRFASARKIFRDPPSNAVGTVSITGAVAAQLDAGTVIQTSDGRQVRTTAIGTIGNAGTATVAATAVIAGEAGNLPANTPGVLQSAPAGIDPNAVIVEMSGGVEAESLASLLQRVLERLRQPPAGGNQFDYPRWAKEVAGVTAAWGFPKRRGAGTMDVAILSNGAPPSDALRNQVAAYLDGLAPPYGDRMILSPQQVIVAVTAAVTLKAGVLLATVQAAAQTALEEYFAGMKPGDTVYRARIETILMSIPGVLDVAMTAPAANVVTVVDAATVEMPFLGVVTLTAAP